MISRSNLAVLLYLAAALHLAGAPAMAWTGAGNGIDYQLFSISGPNKVYVARMDRANTSAAIESSIANGTTVGARETVRNQASRYDDAINYWGSNWGQRNDVAVAINGDFFNGTTGVITGGQIQSGWYCKRFPNLAGSSGFGWTLNRAAFIGGCVGHTASKQYITVTRTAQTQTFQGINQARGSNQLIIYTPQYDSNTHTDNTGVEMDVEMTRPTMILPTPSMAKGYVRAIRNLQGSCPLPFDHIVLSAVGTAATTLLANVQVGDEIGVTQELSNYASDCNSSLPLDWTKTYASVGTNFTFLVNGVPQSTTNAGLINLAPRTAVAYNDAYVYFVVVDGRGAGGSIGMNMADMAAFCLRPEIQAKYGANMDGGGSSTMVVNGSVVNIPSDGSERTVANGLMMINVSPKLQSTTFAVAQSVTTSGSANVRLGPGTNYATITTMGAGASGVVQSHLMQGVYAKGYYWWKVDFGSIQGWVAETLLSGGSPPTITQHPASQTVCADGTAMYTTAATGTGTLSYRWQKNSDDLSEGGHFSNVTTPTLTVSPAAAADIGNYRCVVTNGSGSTPSNAAALAVNSPVSVTIGQPGGSATKSGPILFPITYSGADAVTLSAAHVTLITTGSASGTITVTGSGLLARTVTISSVTGDGTVGISLAAGSASVAGCGGAPGAGPSATVLVDNTGPSAPTVTDQGAWTPLLNTLSASWTPSSDASGSGVSRYEYAIGTSPDVQDVRGWTSVGSAQSVEAAGLSLSEGQDYDFSVRAIDALGNAGQAGVSDGITVAPGVLRIGDVWSVSDGAGIALRDKVVTGAIGGAIWLEEDKRAAGIRVVTQSAVSPGTRVSAAGVLGIMGAERVLFADVVQPTGVGAIPTPVMIAGRYLGGKGPNGSTPGVTSANSLYNVGILVRCSGVVTGSGESSPTDRWFYLDDGSDLTDGGPYEGVRVRCGAVLPPSSGPVAVVGIVTLESVSGKTVPCLRVRSGADILP